MSESALAFFLATRDPAVVSRELTRVPLADLKLEARATGRERLARASAVSHCWEQRTCVNGHDLGIDGVYVMRKRRGEVEHRCKRCAREQDIATRTYKKWRKNDPGH